MPEPLIELDERADRHIYRVHGIERISVTQVLAAAGLIDTRWYTEGGAARGLIVAKATALDDRGMLDETKVEGELWGYVNAWRLFRSENEIEILKIECLCYEPTYQFAGRFDRLLILNGILTLPDIKTGDREPWHQLQTAAYAMTPLPSIEPGSHIARCGIHLRANGTYRLEQHNDFGDRDIFLACLAVAQWKRNHGYKGVAA